jgi:predicted dehydrogenase
MLPFPLPDHRYSSIERDKENKELVAEMTTMGVAVVGAGYWGPNLIRNFFASPDWDLRWVVDLDQDRARQVTRSAPGVRVTSDLSDVLDDPEVVAVAVATPAATHTELVLACLEAGRHALVEKPLAPSLAEGQKLVTVAEDRGLTLMCDHTYCYTPAVLKIRELVQSGHIGDVQYFDSVRVNLGLVQPDIDVLWDLGPHDLSILDFILPADLRPRQISAFGADPVGAGHLCVGYLTMPLGGDAVAHVHLNWLSPTKVRTTLIGGSKKMVVWDDLNPAQLISIYDRGVELREPTGDDDDRYQAQIAYRLGDMVAPSLRESEPLQGVVTEFAAAVRERRPALTDGRAGLRVLELLEAASRSVTAGGTFQDLEGTR